MRDKAIIEKKKQQLIEMTSAFCDSALNEEYKQLCEKLIQKMSRKRKVPFLTGQVEIWAAAIVYALGQINFLFSQSYAPYANADDICNYFGTSKSTTSQKAKRIRDMFKISYYDSEFSTKRVLEENPFNKFVMLDNGLIVPVSIIEDMILKNMATELLQEIKEPHQNYNDDRLQGRRKKNIVTISREIKKHQKTLDDDY